jgi:hypothetical protein
VCAAGETSEFFRLVPASCVGDPPLALSHLVHPCRFPPEGRFRRGSYARQQAEVRVPD